MMKKIGIRVIAVIFSLTLIFTAAYAMYLNVQAAANIPVNTTPIRVEISASNTTSGAPYTLYGISYTFTNFAHIWVDSSSEKVYNYNGSFCYVSRFSTAAADAAVVAEMSTNYGGTFFGYTAGGTLTDLQIALERYNLWCDANGHSGDKLLNMEVEFGNIDNNAVSWSRTFWSFYEYDTTSKHFKLWSHNNAIVNMNTSTRAALIDVNNNRTVDIYKSGSKFYTDSTLAIELGSIGTMNSAHYLDRYYKTAGATSYTYWSWYADATQHTTPAVTSTSSLADWISTIDFYNSGWCGFTGNTDEYLLNLRVHYMANGEEYRTQVYSTPNRTTGLTLASDVCAHTALIDAQGKAYIYSDGNGNYFTDAALTDSLQRFGNDATLSLLPTSYWSTWGLSSSNYNGILNAVKEYNNWCLTTSGQQGNFIKELYVDDEAVDTTLINRNLLKVVDNTIEVYFLPTGGTDSRVTGSDNAYFMFGTNKNGSNQTTYQFLGIYTDNTKDTTYNGTYLSSNGYAVGQLVNASHITYHDANYAGLRNAIVAYNSLDCVTDADKVKRVIVHLTSTYAVEMDFGFAPITGNAATRDAEKSTHVMNVRIANGAVYIDNGNNSNILLHHFGTGGTSGNDGSFFAMGGYPGHTTAWSGRGLVGSGATLENLIAGIRAYNESANCPGENHDIFFVYDAESDITYPVYEEDAVVNNVEVVNGKIELYFYNGALYTDAAHEHAVNRINGQSIPGFRNKMRLNAETNSTSESIHTETIEYFLQCVQAYNLTQGNTTPVTDVKIIMDDTYYVYGPNESGRTPYNPEIWGKHNTQSLDPATRNFNDGVPATYKDIGLTIERGATFNGVMLDLQQVTVAGATPMANCLCIGTGVVIDNKCGRVDPETGDELIAIQIEDKGLIQHYGALITNSYNDPYSNDDAPMQLKDYYGIGVAVTAASGAYELFADSVNQYQRIAVNQLAGQTRLKTPAKNSPYRLKNNFVDVNMYAGATIAKATASLDNFTADILKVTLSGTGWVQDMAVMVSFAEFDFSQASAPLYYRPVFAKDLDNIYFYDGTIITHDTQELENVKLAIKYYKPTSEPAAGATIAGPAAIPQYTIQDPNCSALILAETKNDSVDVTRRVLYDKQGHATNEDQEQTVKQGIATFFTVISDPSSNRQWKFFGWADDSTSNTPVYHAGDVLQVNNSVVSPAYSKILYAVWGFDVEYDANNTGVTNMPANFSAYTSSITLGSQTPSKPGYTFLGWKKNGNGSLYQPGNTVTIEDSDIVNGKVTFVAQWSMDVYTVTFHENLNGETVNGMPTPVAQTYTYGQSFTLPDKPTTTHYTCNGWYTAASGGTKYGDGVTVVVTGNLDIYAQWTPVRYTLSFDKQGGTGTCADISNEYGTNNNIVTIPNTAAYKPTKTGYTFKGWSNTAGATVADYPVNGTNNITLLADKTVYAVWEINQYTVTYHECYPSGEGNDLTPHDTYNYNETFVLRGNVTNTAHYTFDGWFTQQNGGTQVTAGYAVTQNIDLYGHWSPKSYTLTYVLRGGSGSFAQQTNVYGTNSNQVTIYNSKPTYAGHVFAGWSENPDGSTVDHAPNTAITLTSDKTLYAVWQARVRYYKNYSATDLVQDGAPQYAIQSGEGNATANVNFTLRSYTAREGYIFLGWNTVRDGTGDSYAVNDTLTTNQNVDLYAQWYQIITDTYLVYDFGMTNTFAITEWLNGTEYDGLITGNTDINNLNIPGLVVSQGLQIRYTPATINTGVTFTVEYTVEGQNLSKTVHLVPASNVYYEAEDMISAASGWTLDGTADTLANKTVADNLSSVYGFTTAAAIRNNTYNYSAGQAYKASVTLYNGQSEAVSAAPLTFTFTGTGYDIISVCGRDTGMMWVRLCKLNADNEIVGTTYTMADTYFFGDDTMWTDTATRKNYKIPVVEVRGLDYGTYRVEIYAKLNKSSGTVDLVTNGDYRNIGASGVTADVYVDAIRVYGALESDSCYAANEQGVKYVSVYDYIKNSAAAVGEKALTNGVFYVEYNSRTGVVDVADYKQSGSQFEVYLANANGTKSAVGMVLKNWVPGTSKVMVGARKVLGSPAMKVFSSVGSGSTQAVYATEMFYDVTNNVFAIDLDGDNVDESYVLLIQNAGINNTILALTSLKVSNNIQPAVSSDFETYLDTVYGAIEREGQASQTFEPESLKVTYKRYTSSTATVLIKTSTDVKELKLTVPNVGEVTLQPTNAEAVRRGKATECTFYYTAGGIGTYSIQVVSQPDNEDFPSATSATLTTFEVQTPPLALSAPRLTNVQYVCLDN